MSTHRPEAPGPEADAASETLERLLQLMGVLAELGGDSGGVSLTRVAKRLGLRVSVLVRLCTQLGSASLGGQAGPGWVELHLVQARWVACLTPAGRAMLDSLAQEAGQPQT